MLNVHNAKWPVVKPHVDISCFALAAQKNGKPHPFFCAASQKQEMSTWGLTTDYSSVSMINTNRIEYCSLLPLPFLILSVQGPSWYRMQIHVYIPFEILHVKSKALCCYHGGCVTKSTHLSVNAAAAKTPILPITFIAPMNMHSLCIFMGAMNVMWPLLSATSCMINEINWKGFHKNNKSLSLLS